jgi:hypothetical protein
MDEGAVHIAGPAAGMRQECSRCGMVLADNGDFSPEGQFIIIDGLMEASTTADGGTGVNTFPRCEPQAD